MKAIVTTPVDSSFSVVLLKTKNEKIDDFPFYRTLKTPNKHLYIEYDENNHNMLKVMLDLDAMGLSHIKSVEELEELLPKLYNEIGA